MITNKSNTTILVTGGAGFIGSNLVDKLIPEKYSVIIVDNLKTGEIKNVNRKAEFIKFDIRDVNLKRLIREKKPDYIFHLAARASLSGSLKTPSDDIDVNLLGTQNLIEAAKDTNVKKIIFASSAAIYGESATLPIKENITKNPTSIYGVTKLAGEFLMGICSKQYHFPVVVLRFSNVYGPRQDTQGEGGVIAIFIGKIMNDQCLQIFGNGHQTRDFIYIDDVTTACIEALKDKVIGEFNISTSHETSINKIHQLFQSLLARHISKKYTNRRVIEVNRSNLSYNKYNLSTGWKPQIDLTQGLLKTWNYFTNK